MKEGEVVLFIGHERPPERVRRQGETMEGLDTALMKFILDRVPVNTTVELWANAVDVTIPHDADQNALWADGRYAAHDLNQDRWNHQDWVIWRSLSGKRELQVKTAENDG